MTPNPPSSPEGSDLPPRHRPPMGNLAKDTTEQDLWAFDDIDPLEGEITAPRPKSPELGIPVPRDAEKLKVRHLGDPTLPKTGGSHESIRVNVSKNRRPISTASTTGQSEPGSEFDDLDHWDGPDVTTPEVKTSSAIGTTVAASTPAAPADTSTPVTRPEEPRDEIPSPVRETAKPHLRLNLTPLERVGLVALTVLLLIAGAMVFLNTISRLPTGSGSVSANDFPVRGNHLTIISANSYWRAPIAADTARRGTQLVPVVDLTAGGGPGAIRVFFRNSDGDVIGDAVTRFLKSDGQLQIAATAGFDDVGMHAAYRSGGNKSWTVEVLEAATENAAGPEFKKLFEMNIAADRR